MLGCIVLDEYRAFAVDFDKSKTVEHLKKAILEKKKKSLSGIDAHYGKLIISLKSTSRRYIWELTSNKNSEV